MAGVVGLAVFLGVGPARARMVVGLLVGGAGGGLLILLASRQHELVDGLGDSAAAAQGDQMLAVSIAVALAVGIVRFLLDPPIGRIEVRAQGDAGCRRGGRGRGGWRDPARRALEAVGGVQEGRAGRDQEHLCRSSFEQRARQRSISVLVGGGRCLQGSPSERHRRRRLRGILGPARLPGAAGPRRSLALLREHGRAGPGRLGAHPRVPWLRGRIGHPAWSDPVARGSVGRRAGDPGGGHRLGGDRLDLGAVRVLRPRRARGGAPHRAGDASEAAGSQRCHSGS